MRSNKYLSDPELAEAVSALVKQVIAPETVAAQARQERSKRIRDVIANVSDLPFLSEMDYEDLKAMSYEGKPSTGADFTLCVKDQKGASLPYFEPGFDDAADEPHPDYKPKPESARSAPFSTPPVKLADHVSKEAQTNQSHTEAPGKSYAPPVSSPKPSILVSTPTLGGLRGNYFNSALNLLNACTVRGMKLGFSIHEGNSFIQSARNTILREFLKSSYSHLLMLDDDIGYNASDIMRMLDADVDFICGAVPMRQFNLPALHDAVNRLGMRNNLEDFLPKFNVNILDVQSGMVNIDKTTGAMEIAFAGTACILIKRCVAERMLAECVGPFKVDSYKDFQSDGEITYNFFDCFIDETNQLNGEDVSFCKRWRSIGGRIFCLPDMKMSHHGPMTLTGNFMNSLMPAGLNK